MIPLKQVAWDKLVIYGNGLVTLSLKLETGLLSQREIVVLERYILFFKKNFFPSRTEKIIGVLYVG